MGQLNRVSPFKPVKRFMVKTEQVDKDMEKLQCPTFPWKLLSQVSLYRLLMAVGSLQIIFIQAWPVTTRTHSPSGNQNNSDSPK